MGLIIWLAFILLAVWLIATGWALIGGGFFGTIGGIIFVVVGVCLLS